MTGQAPTATEVAEKLLDEFATIRRATRSAGGRPAVYSSLTGSQMELLRLVRRRPGISVAEAARLMALAPNTVSTLVHVLTRRRLLVRAADETDRRVAHLDLTPEMRRSAEVWRDRRVSLVTAALERLPPEQRARLEAVLPALAGLAAGLEPVGSR